MDNTSIDLDCPSGKKIPIEEVMFRSAQEVTHVLRQQIAPSEVAVAHPAFDVTPHRLVSAIITEKGIARGPYSQSLPKFVKRKR